jgi:RNA polymerase sigma-70 factor (ECF subfamily)
MDGDPSTTADLLKRAREGDRDAMEQAFMRQLQTLRRWASGRLPHWARDVADTDDLIQDVFLQTFKRIDDFEARGPGALHAYLRQSVLNRMRDEIRRRVRRPLAVQADGGLPSDGPRRWTSRSGLSRRTATSRRSTGSDPTTRSASSRGSS